MKSTNPPGNFALRELVPPADRSANKQTTGFSPGFKLLYFLFFVLGFSSIGRAQTPSAPSDCKTGCTSNDVQIQAAYLTDKDGNKLAQNFICPVSGSANVYLSLELTTKTPRVGVVIFTKVKRFTPPSTIGSEIATISQCFGIALDQPTNKVTFTTPFNWECGVPIVLTDVFIGWGTGNTNFCTGSAFQCPATSSKCYSLPPGNYIPIQTPSARPASAIKCSTQPGGSWASFNLTDLESTVKGSQSNVTVTWFSDINLANSIGTPGAYNSQSGTVYAKVASNSNPAVFSKSTVTLTVTSTAAAPALGKVDNCDGTTTLTASGLVAGAALTWSDGGSGNPRSVTTQSAFTVTQTIDGCTSATSNAVTPATKSNPPAPSATVIQPTCGTPTGTITVTGEITGLMFSINSTNAADFTNSTGVFSGLGIGTHLIRFKNSDGCISEPLSKTISAASAAPATPVVAVKTPASCSSAAIVLEVTSPLGSDYQYSNNNGAWQTSVLFNINAGDGYNIKARRISDNSCMSGIASCGATGGRSSQTTTSTATTPKISATPITETDLKSIVVKAYPNPFNETINFVVNSPVSGSGSLEIYNALGQKIKNVYHGNIMRGSQNFQMRLPLRQTANLVYVLRVGDQRISGKILQLNR